jgi:pimeloyl-ACP methyl ester carboxylesterase
MEQLESILEKSTDWTIIGSSFGGLMGALFTCQNPNIVKKLILLAPALIWPDFAVGEIDPVSVPTIVFHGAKDEIIPLRSVRDIATGVFLNLTFHEVEDDHGLYKTVHEIDWEVLVGR